MFNHADHYREFYRTPLGCYVQAGVTQIINHFWNNFQHQVVLGVGFVQPYAPHLMEMQNKFLGVIPHGCMHRRWPRASTYTTAVVNQDRWPFQDDTVDKIVIIHCLEFYENKLVLLHEAMRVLKPQGRIVVIIPDKSGLWSQWDHTPFKANFPLLPYETKLIFDQVGFNHINMKKIFLSPPFDQPAVLNIMTKLEKINDMTLNNVGGVIACQAIKEVHHMVPSAPKQSIGQALRPLRSPCKG